MPLDGSGVASKPAGTTAIADETISSAAFNSFADDVYAIFNTPRPIAFGGTGDVTPIGGHDALDTNSVDLATATTLNLDNATGAFAKIAALSQQADDAASIIRKLQNDDKDVAAFLATRIPDALRRVLPYAPAGREPAGGADKDGHAAAARAK